MNVMHKICSLPNRLLILLLVLFAPVLARAAEFNLVNPGGLVIRPCVDVRILVSQFGTNYYYRYDQMHGLWSTAAGTNQWNYTLQEIGEIGKSAQEAALYPELPNNEAVVSVEFHLWIEAGILNMGEPEGLGEEYFFDGYFEESGAVTYYDDGNSYNGGTHEFHWPHD